MRIRNIKAIVASVFAAFAVATASAQIPQGYYSSLKGKKGAELKTAVYNIIKNGQMLKYGSGNGSSWYGFYETDNDNGYVIDRYSNERYKYGKQGEAVGGMNIEHSFPQSWWGKTNINIRRDLFNILPSDSKANNAKQNYGMGVVTNATYENGCIKVGMGSEGFRVWQPSKEWEGDFSRSMMYIVTAYQNLTWQSDEAFHTIEQNTYPTLKKWAQTLYMKWAKEDPVNELEVKRNNAVYKLQGNRNPFIDFPNLMEYIWGDSVNYAFDPAKTVNTENYKDGGGSSTDPDTPQPGDSEATTIYTANYRSSDGGCTLELTKNPSDTYKVWTRGSKYGWKGSGFISSTKTNTESDGCVVTPELDLTGCESATFNFSHAVNFDDKPTERLSVEVRCDGNVAKLGGINWPSGNNWTFVNSGDIDLSQYAGKKIRIAFHYTSTTATAGTWEISDIAVKGKKTSTGIGCIANPTVGAFDPSAPYTVYDLAGRRVNGIGAANGIVIVKQQGKTFKMKR